MPALLDITRRLSEFTPPWPGDEPLRQTSREEAVGELTCRVSSLSLGAHLGTHLDAPAHLSSDARALTVDQIDLAVLIGPARVIDARGRASIGPELFQSLSDCPPRLLLRTDNSERPLDVTSFVALTEAAAGAVVSRACLLLGIDGPSPDPADSVELPAHRVLLEAGVVLLEGLDLHGVAAGDYELLCLPMALEGIEAAPVRAVLRSLS